MPETQVAPTVTTTETTTEEKSLSETLEKHPFVARGKSWTEVSYTQTKGKGAGKDVSLLDKNDNETYAQFLTRFAEVIGVANYEKLVVKEVVHALSKDAMKDAQAAAEKAGRADFTTEEWFEAICQGALPGARRSSDGVKQLKERLVTVMKEMEPLMKLHVKKETRDKMTPDQINRLLSLMADFSELSEKVEGKSKTGKKGATA